MNKTILGLALSSAIAAVSAFSCSPDNEPAPSLPDAGIISDGMVIPDGGTTTSTVPKYDVKSPEGIKVLLNGYTPDLSFLDLKFDAAADCLESIGYSINRNEKRDYLLVEIVTDQRTFPCGAASPSGNCSGLFFRPSGARLYAKIQLTAGLHAGAYESARHLTNDYGTDASEDTFRCGDDIDHLLGHR